MNDKNSNDSDTVVCLREMGKMQQCWDFYRMVLLSLGGMEYGQ
jgi:hypothetical protein